MRKGIFILFGGLPPTVIESQVILHVKEYVKLGHIIEVWCFADNKKEYSDSLKNLPLFQKHGVTIRLFKAIRPRLVFLFMNSFRLLLISRHMKFVPEFIHARTEYATVVALIVKLFLGCKVIWDCRGDSKSENIFLAGNWSPLQKMLLPLFNWASDFQSIVAKHFADRCVFVSKALKNIHFPGKESKSIFIIPCFADPELFFFDTNLRSITRENLNIAKDERALIYSGGTSSWQFFSEVTKLVKNALRTSNKIRVIFLCPDPGFILNLFSKIEQKRIVAKYVLMTEVNKYLNAADFAIFLREKVALNWVASPVKFSEYSLTGIPVIMTDSVDQCNSLSSILGNRIDYEVGKSFCIPPAIPDAQREKTAILAKKILTRASKWSSLSSLYKFEQ